jgi:hypothetical protein
MCSELQIINPINYPKWNELLLTKEGACIFHSSAWARVLFDTYHYSPLYFVIIEDNELSVAIPFMEVKSAFTGWRGVSLPFSDYCDPIVSKEVNFQDVLNQISEYGKRSGWKYIEIRGGNGFLSGVPYSANYYGHNLDITQGEERLYANLRNSTRRNIKRAAKEGVQVKICTSLEAIGEFYRLNCITRKGHGLPPQPYCFFETIYNYIIKKELGFIVLATYQEKTIAGAMYFHFGDKAIYKYGASDKRYQHLRPNNLVMWEAIKWYSKNGFHSFSFGRTEPNAGGQRQFKTGWGTSETIIKYYTYDLRKRDFIERKAHVSGIHNKIFNALPVNLLKIAGSLLYRHMG